LEEERDKKTQHIQKTNSKMAEVNPTLSIITLNAKIITLMQIITLNG
jgi:hypothetical protein